SREPGRVTVAARLSLVPHPDAILRGSSRIRVCVAADITGAARMPVLVRRVVGDHDVPGDIPGVDVEGTLSKRSPVVDVVPVPPPVAVLHAAVPPEVRPGTRHGCD